MRHPYWEHGVSVMLASPSDRHDITLIHLPTPLKTHAQILEESQLDPTSIRRRAAWSTERTAGPVVPAKCRASNTPIRSVVPSRQMPCEPTKSLWLAVKDK